MPRRRPSEDLRARILDACDVQLASGPGAITVREVAAAAGVSNGTLYHYFPSLDDLLLASAGRAASRQTEAFGDLAGGVLPVLKRLFDPRRSDTILPWLRLRAQASPALSAALQRYDLDVNTAYTATIRGAADDIGIRDDVDIEAIVEVVRALAEGLQLRVASDTLAVGSERFVAAVLDAITTTWLKPSAVEHSAESRLRTRA